MFDHAALGDRQERIHVRLFVFHGHTLFAAHHEVMDALGEMLWQAQRAGRPPDGAAYVDAVQRRATKD